MATTSAAPESSGDLAPGAQLGGGRYRVGERRVASPLGEIRDGVEKASGRAVEILAVAPELCAELEDSAAALPAGVPGIVEVASEGAVSYVVMEGADAHPVSDLLHRKKQTGSAGFAPRAAASLIGRLAAALEPAHQAGVAHGWIGLPSVRVDKSGGVTLIGLGLAPALEARTGRAPDAADDIAALGALLYHLLTGNAPSKGCSRPSQLIAGLNPAVDQVIASAMHPQRERRPASVSELRAMLKKALEAAPAAAPRAAAAPALSESLAGPAPAASAPMPAASSGQMSAALTDTDEAWLINKDRLDYGPFTMAQIVEQIQRDEILPGHLLINKHSGDRTPVEEHPLLSEIVDEAKAARDERRRAQAEVVHAKTERRRGALVYVFIGAAVLGLAAGAYFVVEALSADKTEKKAGLGSIEEGKLEAKISFPSTEKKTRRGRRGKGRKGGAGGMAGGWDDTVDLGDVSEGGGDERLSDAQINPVIQRAGGRLGRCLTKTGERNAAIDFIVKGSGRVAYVRVNGKTDTALANCVRGVMKSLQFPTFDGARTKANFNMSF